MPGSRSFVIDTDTASDDAIAIIQALRHPRVNVRAITVVAGNVPVQQAARNAFVTLELASAEVPLHIGLAGPITRPLETAQAVHGVDGMSEVTMPEPQLRPSDEHAVEALIRIAREESGLHELITLGPLSNIAAALLIQPDLLTNFARVWMMIGAADSRGNVTPTAEFNAWVDPEAAALVFGAPGDKVMIGWDVSRKYAVIGEEEDRALRSLGTLGLYASQINESLNTFCRDVSGIRGYDLADPVAMAVALEPGIVTAQHLARITISTDLTTRGQTFRDWRFPRRTPNITVVTGVDESRFKAHLFTALRGH